VFSPHDISYYIISLGCSKNLVDSEYVNGSLLEAGFSPSETSEDADIIIINTCGFINDAKEESIDVILEALDLKLANAPRWKGFIENGIISRREFGVKVVATGCLTQRYYDEIGKEIPEIDFLYGLPDAEFALRMCEALGISRPLSGGTVREPLTPGLPYAYLKISEGCSNNCSYCAIPLIRGPHRPLSPEEIMRDAEQAASRGAVELNIIAQDIAAYNWKGKGLVEIVDMVSRIKGVQWIRLLYCHPDHCTDELIDCIGENEKVVRYIDIPFQHASGSILRSMNRKGNREIYLDLVEKLRARVPGIRIRSTFMVGYPGEGDADFRELMDFIREARLDRVGAFIYSPEEDTAACGLPGRVPEKVSRKRYEELMRVQKEISEERLSGLVGTEVDVLVEERYDEETLIGRSEFDAPEVDGIFYLTAAEDGSNPIVRARVTDSIEHDLIGEII